MLQSKRRPYSIDSESIVMAGKRNRVDIPVSPKEKHDKKEKFGERISALQQLVSPYGKTDTASVLLEAMEYIKFLQEQVKVLSAPYLQCTPALQIEESEQCSLRTRGLCLVPIACTAAVAQSNGADMWAPIKNCSTRF